MSSYAWDVYHDDGTLTQIDNVQSITISKGRQQIQDPFRVGTATITGRVPSGLPDIKIGDRIDIFTASVSPSFKSFAGEVSDFKINYGTIPELDTWEIYAEDGFASIGRAVGTGSFTAGDTPFTAALYLIATVAGLTISNAYPLIGSNSTVSAYSFTNESVLDLIQKLIFTEQGRIYPIQPGQFGWLDRAALGQLPTVCSFSDGTLTATADVVKMQSTEFFSQADSRFNRVVITPEGLAPQTAGTTTGTAFEGASFDQTTTGAGNLAAYVLATLQVNRAVPYRISTTSEVQSNSAVLDAYGSAGQGGRAEVILRSVKSVVYIEGATLSATPEQTRFSFNLVSSDSQNFLILDDPVFGVLDANRLGF